MNGGVVGNRGVQAQLTIVPVRAESYEWSAVASYTRNRNRVESLDGLESASLGPTRWGVRLDARPNQPLGTIVGSRFLRVGATNEIITSNGLPVADTTGGGRALGSAQPSWFGGISNTVRYGRFELGMLVDGQVGGRVFSASNMVGAVSGNLAETEFRPDSGLVLAGVDSITGQPNTVHVSTEADYHALGAIAERWVYDASFMKLRELRISGSFNLPATGPFQTPSLKVSLVGRNLALWAKAPNVDPEGALGAPYRRGLELAPLPATRSLGVQVTITP
jgi:hypothetical protein